MKKLTTFLFLFLFAFALQGQKIIMNEGKAKVLYAYDADQPLNVPETCEFWIEGKHSSSFTLDGTSVDRWWDLSGNDRHCNNTNDDATRPTWDSSTGRVTFIAANNTFLQSAAFGSALSQPNTIFVVYKITGDLGDNEIIFAGRDAVTTSQFSLWTNNFLGYAGASLIAEVADINNNIHVIEFNGLNSNYWINGILKVSGNMGEKSLGAVLLGEHPTGGYHADCEIMEVLVYDCDLSDISRDKLTGYLADKWGITATTDFKGYILRQD